MCGIFAVLNVPKVAELTVIGLHSIQHRAVDFAGIVSTDGRFFFRERGPGIARQVFTKEMLDRLHGFTAVGHIRYPTVNDDKTRDNIQPIVGVYNGQPIAVAHNGNLTNVDELREALSTNKMSTSMDTELILRLLEMHCTGDIIADLKSIAPMLKGSYALVIMLPDHLLAVRDASGNRPLSIGTLQEGYCVSSETCAFANVGATHLNDVAPGQIVSIRKSGLKTSTLARGERKLCRFEGIYYAHPASVVFNERVGQFRMDVGRTLERNFPVRADIITPIPDSSNFIAMGFAESGASGKYFPVIARNHYVGRTFIAATQAQRDLEVSQKFTFTAEEIEGKRIVVVDDSIVRGTTLPKIVRELRRLGAREVHVRIGSPPIKFPCIYGINTPSVNELVAATRQTSEILKLVGADTLEFLPIEMLKELTVDSVSHCFACMDGHYW